MYHGKPQGVSGLNAVVSWPPEEWGRDPARFAEMRPGVYNVHERVRDMNRNGILASMCFPTFTGFSARHLNQFREEVTLPAEWASKGTGPRYAKIGRHVRYLLSDVIDSERKQFAEDKRHPA